MTGREYTNKDLTREFLSPLETEILAQNLKSIEYSVRRPATSIDSFFLLISCILAGGGLLMVFAAVLCVLLGI